MKYYCPTTENYALLVWNKNITFCILEEKHLLYELYTRMKTAATFHFSS